VLGEVFERVQTDRRPLTSFATLDSGKLRPSFDRNSLSSVGDATDYQTAASSSSLTQPPEQSFVPPCDHESRLYGASSSTASIQPFPGQAEQHGAGMPNPLRSHDVDGVPVGSWVSDVGCSSYDTIDYRTAEYSQAAATAAYTGPVAIPDTAADVSYQIPGRYQTTEWGYHQSLAGGSSAGDAIEDSKDHVT